MTCKELRRYWGSDSGIKSGAQWDVAEVSEHISNCQECNRVVRQWQEIANCLSLLRDSVPPIPDSLDQAVLAGYRRYPWKHSHMAVPVRLRILLKVRESLAWTTAVAFAFVVAYGGMLLFSPRQRGWLDRQVEERQPIAASFATTARSKETEQREITAAKEPVPKKRDHIVASARHADYPISTIEPDDAFQASFKSLMYCDQLSCSGAMDVIHVQLPAPLLGVMPASVRAGGVVSAYVLVGTDGIARGIRVVD
jgi:hypothetical protein